jgi:ABC-type glutathione transport system ATPase component
VQQTLANSSTTIATSREPLLDVRNLCVAFHDGEAWYEVLKDISFAVEPGEVVGIVGESGCGKSLTALSILGLLPRHGCRLSGEIAFERRDLAKLSERELRDVRGRRISMVFQEPMSALDPVFPVGARRWSARSKRWLRSASRRRNRQRPCTRRACRVACASAC